MRLSTLATVFSLLFVTSLTGCGSGAVGGSLPDVVPATGKITMGGSPLAGATVLFRPNGQGFAASAVSEEDGSFVLRTGPQEGAVVGNYMVTVTKKVIADTQAQKFDPGEDSEHHEYKEGDTIQSSVNELDAKYASPKTSGLKAEIPSGGTSELLIELEF